VTGTRIRLALGSGGARGYAHIGAVQVLEERGYEIAAISGTSMGALVGAARAAGALEEYAEWASGLTQRDVLRLLDPSLRAPYGIRGEKILARFNELVGSARIEELPIPYTSVATDLLARKEVWFQQGPVDVAVRASIALPTFIKPVMLNGRLLVDGGLMNPLPIAPMAGVHADLTVAIDLVGERLHAHGQTHAPSPESSEPRGGGPRPGARGRRPVRPR
jgi:NTE family protein